MSNDACFGHSAFAIGDLAPITDGEPDKQMLEVLRQKHITVL
jgi:hypothetical protein